MPGFDDKQEWTEIRYRVKDPGAFDPKSFVRLTLGKGIAKIRGKLKSSGEMATQALRFKKPEWTVERARKWVAEHRANLALEEPDLMFAEEEEDVSEFVDFEVEQSGSALKTATVRNVEMFKAGTHVDSNGRKVTVTIEKLRKVPAHFAELLKRGFRPMLRLTHDAKHKFLGGLPGLGVPTNLKIAESSDGKGMSLWGDLKRVPILIAEVMKVGGYDSLSAGLAAEFVVGDYTADLALHHMALLGAQHPAIPDLQHMTVVDLPKLYGMEAGEHSWSVLKGELSEFASAGEDFEMAYLFEDAGECDPEKEEGGEVELKELMAKYECSSPEELDRKLAAAAKAETDNKAAQDELAEERKKVRLARAEGFLTTHRKKIAPKFDEGMKVVLTELGASDTTMQFARGEGKVEELDVIGIFGEFVSSLPDAADFEEKGKDDGGKSADETKKEMEKEKEEKEKKEKEKGDDDEGGGGTTDDLEEEVPELNTEAVEKVNERAKELIKEQREQGETLSMADALAQATIELASSEKGLIR